MYPILFSYQFNTHYNAQCRTGAVAFSCDGIPAQRGIEYFRTAARNL